MERKTASSKSRTKSDKVRRRAGVSQVLARGLDEEPRSRFSDAAIEYVFSHLHRWQISPADEEMQAAVKRFFWLGEQKDAGGGAV